MASLRYRARGLDTIGLRFTFVYGAGRLRGRSSYPSHLIRSAAAGQRVQVPYSDQILNWQYVEDLADLVVKVLTHPQTSRQAAYNVNGEPRTLGEAGQALQSLLGDSVSGYDQGKDPNYATTPMALDDSALREEFRWSASFPLARGIKASISEYAAMARLAVENSQ